jgi:hypothetical protein
METVKPDKKEEKEIISEKVYNFISDYCSVTINGQ